MQVTSKAGHHDDLPRGTNSQGQTTKMEIKDWGWRFYFNSFLFPSITLITRHSILDHTGLSCSSPALRILREEYRVPRSCSRDTETDKKQAGRQAGARAHTHTILFMHWLSYFLLPWLKHSVIIPTRSTAHQLLYKHHLMQSLLWTSPWSSTITLHMKRRESD